MTKEGRIKLGLEWKRRILENKNRSSDRKLIVPKGINLDHPYIKEAEQGSAPLSSKGKGKKPEAPQASADDEGSKLADKIMKGGK
jgi:hypothetical protein